MEKYRPLQHFSGTFFTCCTWYLKYLKSVAGVSISPFSILTIGVIFSILTIGVIYFWKGGDTRMSEIKFSGTTSTTGNSGTRYIRYQRYLKSVARISNVARGFNVARGSNVRPPGRPARTARTAGRPY